MKEYYDVAREKMKGFCRVCPQCNGKACVGQVPGMGGLGTGSSFAANVEALARYKFNMRLIHDVTAPDTSIDFLGQKLSMPVLAAPIGGVSFNMGGGISEEEYIDSVIGGCLAAGTLGCTGDGVPEWLHSAGFSAIEKNDGKGIPFIKPWENEELDQKIEKAVKSGTKIFGMDIDAAGLVTLRQMGRPVSPKTPEALKKIIDSTSMKFILKGVMTVDEAKMAAEIGVDAIVVSNHGGRVLDFAPGAADVLASIADAVKGKVTIIADGGVRSGGDVLKLLALGADAVMIGRPVSVAAVGGLQDGVQAYLEKIRGELIQTMVLTGTASAGNVSREILA
ncbi:alpha-hydroxy-acid oxidizing protein [Desulfosediminicola ganghwensis]|uniref:alpha-hydroxy-acid oxidizing protein n=1 Tax=Desulfosediminicola ganghwensis TaxID=2569540 RepID=UPI0010ABE0D1|nr:alpha-hydroxy-acid oxidizing protein [Desulfosediminicola ganghwensis]